MAPPLPQTSSSGPFLGESVSTTLGRELGGDLPCVGCGYNLKGLSIRSMCPECGAAVRAAILAVVDPHARELQPMAYPKLISAGLIAWSVGGVSAALLSWLPHLAEVMRYVGVQGMPKSSVVLGVCLSLIISGIGSLAFLRPHSGLPTKLSVLAMIGTLLYLPLIWTTWQQQMLTDRAGGPSYLRGVEVPTDIIFYFVLSSIEIGVSIVCLRPMLQVLVARSVVLRNGRVDRQTMVAMAAAAGMMALGGAILLLQPSGRSATFAAELSHITGVVVIALGALLLTIGLLGCVVDCLRIVQAILVPRPTLKQVIRTGVSPAKPLSRVLDPTPPPEKKT